MTSKQSITDNIAALYDKNMRDKGICSSAVGWSDDVGHEIRSKKLSYLVADEDGPFSVNDLGCGYGAFLAYLLGNGFEVSHYNGYDISKEMISSAQSVLPKSNVSLFNHGSLETKADYSFAGGTFNVRGAADQGDWLKFIFRNLDEMREYSVKGFAFNLLTTRVDWRDDALCYGDPELFVNYCTDVLGCRVALLHDYPLFEWTLVARVK